MAAAAGTAADGRDARILTWNINGLRKVAASHGGVKQLLDQFDADIGANLHTRLMMRKLLLLRCRVLRRLGASSTTVDILRKVFVESDAASCSTTCSCVRALLLLLNPARTFAPEIHRDWISRPNLDRLLWQYASRRSRLRGPG